MPISQYVILQTLLRSANESGCNFTNTTLQCQKGTLEFYKHKKQIKKRTLEFYIYSI